MAETTEISWADATFNPWMGCTKVSPACKHCYAERDMDHRYSKVKWGPQGTRLRTSESNWRKPLTWDRKAKAEGRRLRVFCASLADVFEDRPELEPWRDDLFDLIYRTRNLDWLLLTKRPENIMPMVGGLSGAGCTEFYPGGVFDHVWLGTSVESRDYYDRVYALQKFPATVRFLSVEPMLGPMADMPLNGIHWVITGGESGPDARPTHPDWFRGLRDRCKVFDVPFHFKQWGEWRDGSSRTGTQAAVLNNGRAVIPDSRDGRAALDRELRFEWNRFNPTAMSKVGKKAAGRLLDGRTWDEFPSPSLPSPVTAEVPADA